MEDSNTLLLKEAYGRLKDLNNSFNMARLLMDDAELRKEAGDMVRENREFLDRLFTALALRPDASAGANPDGA